MEPSLGNMEDGFPSKIFDFLLYSKRTICGFALYETEFLTVDQKWMYLFILFIDFLGTLNENGNFTYSQADEK
jgi:hypothetical protein